jgi:hypothetical protein
MATDRTFRISHAQLVKAIKKLVTEHGGFIYKHYSGGPVGLRGVADLIGVFGGQAIAIEVKVGRDKLTKEQENFLKEWKNAGGIALEARDIKTVADELGIPMLL